MRRIGRVALIVALFFGLNPLAFFLSSLLRYWRARGLTEGLDFVCAYAVRGVALLAKAWSPTSTYYRLSN